ncbi:MAG: hypothetical protein M1839_001462 [Geoglossum umbratile]|nr:MAG: hypothetical protein M1839_001462 [Geoglossum umbratile]
MPLELTTYAPSDESSGLIIDVRMSPDGESLTVEFRDATFTFHSQWLHDTQMDDGPYKENVADTYTNKNSFAQIQNVNVSGRGIKTTLEVSWNDGKTARIPSIWLRVYAPLVARHHGNETAQTALRIPKGWLTDTLVIPEIAYDEIFPKISQETALRIYEAILHESFPGVLKVTNLPPLVVNDSQRKGENALVATVLTQIFGTVFWHPRRTQDSGYPIASHSDKRGTFLPNYDTSQRLLPHTDQSFYYVPTRIDGLHVLEGESENTFVSCPAVLQTLQEESPELVEPLFITPLAFGRRTHMYSPPQYQAATSTTITTIPGLPNHIHRFRWHPHIVGALLSPFSEFPIALLAHRKFQEIASRDTHQLKLSMKPGDMYLFDNCKVLHGRDRVLTVPRTCIGHSVPEQVAVDRWREILTAKLMRVLKESWLVHVPLAQLYELDKIADAFQTQ